MAAELRWILLGFSLVLLAGIWWWGARRSAQAPGNAALREIKPTPGAAHADAADPCGRNRPSPARAKISGAEIARVGVALRTLEHPGDRLRARAGIGWSHDGVPGNGACSRVTPGARQRGSAGGARPHADARASARRERAAKDRELARVRRRANPDGPAPRCCRRSSCMALHTVVTRYFIAGMWTGAVCFASRASWNRELSM